MIRTQGREGKRPGSDFNIEFSQNKRMVPGLNI